MKGMLWREVEGGRSVVTSVGGGGRRYGNSVNVNGGSSRCDSLIDSTGPPSPLWKPALLLAL